jgi:hypothetical protein
MIALIALIIFLVGLLLLGTREEKAKAQGLQKAVVKEGEPKVAEQALLTALIQVEDPKEIATTASLMEEFGKCWNADEKKFIGIKGDNERFIKLATKNNDQFKNYSNLKTDYGYIEKRDLQDGSKVIVRADLHGDLKSIYENLKTLQVQGYLDNNFRCYPHVHLVLLGDYVDRGPHSLEVLELVLTLRLENPNQVTLIRGNHEDLHLNNMYAGDNRFTQFVKAKNIYARCLLERVYQSMPLTLFLSQVNGQGPRQYIQFTHGLFELYVDPSEMINDAAPTARMVVPKRRLLSERIKNIPIEPKVDTFLLARTLDKAERKKIKVQLAAQRLIELWDKDKERAVEDFTVYNWGDVAPAGIEGVSQMGDPGIRQWKLTPEDAKHCARVLSPIHPIKMIIRGHEHKKRHHRVNDDVFITTLPIGMYLGGYSDRFEPQLDTVYILSSAVKVNDWTKEAILRYKGKGTKIVTPKYPLRTEFI